MIAFKAVSINLTRDLSTGMALSCKETFSLLYYEFDAAHKEPPPWEPESYKLIDRIAADEGRFTSNSEVRPPASAAEHVNSSSISAINSPDR